MFDGDSDGLRRLGKADCPHLLSLCDRNQLTLLLRFLCRASLPDWVRDRLDCNYRNHSQRFERLCGAVTEIAFAFEKRSLGFILLKGFAHAAAFSPDVLIRAQGDIDIWCKPSEIHDAQQILRELGYHGVGRSQSRHLAPMIKETIWEWSGDYFASDLPLPVDLHYCLWDAEFEGFPALIEDEVRKRAHLAETLAGRIPVLSEIDCLAFSALHLLMHILHGDLRLNRAWELAYFLRHRMNDAAFWLNWRDRYPDNHRVLQTLVFRLVDLWFDCGLPPILLDNVKALPSDIRLWIEHFGWSPVESLFTAKKDELLLHLTLLPKGVSRTHLLLRRLLPVHSAIESPGRPGMTASVLAERSLHHAKTLATSGAHGLKWWWVKKKAGVVLRR